MGRSTSSSRANGRGTRPPPTSGCAPSMPPSTRSHPTRSWSVRSGTPRRSRRATAPAAGAWGAGVAVVRSTAGEQLLVLANVSDAPVSGVALALVAGPLCGSPVAEVVTGEGTPTAPTISPAGGFAGYGPPAGVAGSGRRHGR